MASVKLFDENSTAFGPENFMFLIFQTSEDSVLYLKMSSKENMPPVKDRKR
jgi:hypothetical protein